ncbi:MAG: hypothetical protein ACI3X4_05720 [Bacteroidaceae bacterium]
MLKLAFITLGFVAVAVLLLCIKVIILPGGKFGSFHISDSKAMRKRGIHCVQSMDRMDRMANPRAVKEREGNT